MKATEMEKLGSKFIFHVGYPRTGSTYLQKYIFPQYADEAVLGLDLGWYLLPKNGVQGQKDDLVRYVSTYFDKAGYDADKPIIYSWEDLSGDILTDYYEMPEKIHSSFPGSKAILCIRSQYTMIPSLYSYAYIKDGGSLTYKQYLDLVLKNDKLNYLKMVRSYIDFLGGDSVLVLLYERLRETPAAFMEELFGFMSLTKKWNLKFGDQFRNVRYPDLVVKGLRVVNAALEKTAIDRMLRQSGRDNPKGRVRSFCRTCLLAVSKVNEITGFYDPPGFEYFSDSRKAIRRHYQNSNRELFSMLNIDPDRYGYPA